MLDGLVGVGVLKTMGQFTAGSAGELDVLFAVLGLGSYGS